ncbi:MAG: TIGR04348 family glycosyltransferase [Deltaproteobacteria bacterium]|nr:TIGR04348 family glycosyltransferase [Deltaproteobacteria bacterium]
MKIKLVTPAPANARNGNRATADRWAKILRQLGHLLQVEQSYDGGECDVLIALHARRSFDSISQFREKHPDLPLIVVLTGTDLYRDIRTNANAQKSLEWATRLIVLQSMGLAELPRRLHSKTRVIYQSVPPISAQGRPPRTEFQVCVIGHLRPEKDPMRTAMAARLLPASSKIKVIHIGRALSREMETRAREEARRNPRYHWVRDLPHWKTMEVLRRSHLLSLTSRMEGSSNVLGESIVLSVPVVASRISGLVGTLGENYPAYYPVGDTRALAELLLKVESDPKLYAELRNYCARLRPLVKPERERSAWKALLRELT